MCSGGIFVVAYSCFHSQLPLSAIIAIWIITGLASTCGSFLWHYTDEAPAFFQDCFHKSITAAYVISRLYIINPMSSAALCVAFSVFILNAFGKTELIAEIRGDWQPWNILFQLCCCLVAIVHFFINSKRIREVLQLLKLFVIGSIVVLGTIGIFSNEIKDKETRKITFDGLISILFCSVFCYDGFSHAAIALKNTKSTKSVLACGCLISIAIYCLVFLSAYIILPKSLISEDEGISITPHIFNLVTNLSWTSIFANFLLAICVFKSLLDISADTNTTKEVAEKSNIKFNNEYLQKFASIGMTLIFLGLAVHKYVIYFYFAAIFSVNWLFYFLYAAFVPMKKVILPKFCFGLFALLMLTVSVIVEKCVLTLIIPIVLGILYNRFYSK